MERMSEIKQETRSRGNLTWWGKMGTSGQMRWDGGEFECRVCWGRSCPIRNGSETLRTWIDTILGLLVSELSLACIQDSMTFQMGFSQMVLTVLLGQSKESESSLTFFRSPETHICFYKFVFSFITEVLETDFLDKHDELSSLLLHT